MFVAFQGWHAPRPQRKQALPSRAAGTHPINGTPVSDGFGSQSKPIMMPRHFLSTTAPSSQSSQHLLPMLLQSPAQLALVLHSFHAHAHTPCSKSADPQPTQQAHSPQPVRVAFCFNLAPLHPLLLPAPPIAHAPSTNSSPCSRPCLRHCVGPGPGPPCSFPPSTARRAQHACSPVSLMLIHFRSSRSGLVSGHQAGAAWAGSARIVPCTQHATLPLQTGSVLFPVCTVDTVVSCLHS